MKSLQHGEDQLGSLLFDVYSDEDSSFEVVKVPEAKGIYLNNFHLVSNLSRIMKGR